MKKYYFVDPITHFFGEVHLQTSQSVDPATTPTTILGNLIMYVSPVASTSTNATVYNAFVAAFLEGAYSSETALIAYAVSKGQSLFAVKDHDKPPVMLVASTAS